MFDDSGAASPREGKRADFQSLLGEIEKRMAGGEYPPEPAPPDPEIERAELEGKRIARLKAMNVGRIFWRENFETFSAYTPELARHLATARKFAERPEGKLVMLGNNGAGKNHLAASILQKTGGAIYTAFEISVRLRASYGGRGSEAEVLCELCEMPMLVIDEIGRTKGEAFDINWLSHVVNKRHENALPLVLISNRHLMDDCPEYTERGCRKCLENFFDNDVISRIVEDGEIMKFAGADYRERIRERRRTGR